MMACTSCRPTTAARARAPDAPRLLRGRTVPSPARRGPVRPRAHDDDDVLPILGPHTKTEFTPEELDKLAHPHLLGGKTMGDELAILRERYVAAEARARDGESRLSSAAWDGDVYVGPALNVGTVLAGIALAVPMAGLAFAAATKGVLWGLVDYYGY